MLDIQRNQHLRHAIESFKVFFVSYSELNCVMFALQELVCWCSYASSRLLTAK